MKNLRNRLKAYMGEYDFSVREVAAILDRHPLTIWKFLRGKTKPHDQTLYKIEALVKLAESPSQRTSFSRFFSPFPCPAGGQTKAFIRLKQGFSRGGKGEWRGTELNRRRRDFQSLALPTELPRHTETPPGLRKRDLVYFSGPRLSTIPRPSSGVVIK